jgi:hypothetical protein
MRWHGHAKRFEPACCVCRDSSSSCASLRKRSLAWLVQHRRGGVRMPFISLATSEHADVVDIPNFTGRQKSGRNCWPTTSPIAKSSNRQRAVRRLAVTPKISHFSTWRIAAVPRCSSAAITTFLPWLGKRGFLSKRRRHIDTTNKSQ